MQWKNRIFVLLFIQFLLINDIYGSATRRRNRRQTSGSQFGTNAYLGASAPAPYNRPANVNIDGIRMNNPDARNLFFNPMISTPLGYGTLQSVNLYALPREQIDQVFGVRDPTILNGLYSGNYYYGAGGVPLWPSYENMLAYPADPNQVIATRDNQFQSPNMNNVPMGYNRQGLANGNNYAGSMSANSNRNSWSNNNYNNNNQYYQNTGNSWTANRNNPYSGSNGNGNSPTYNYNRNY